MVELYKTTITGQPIVKKNTQRSSRQGFRYDMPVYKNWHRKTLEQFQIQGFDITRGKTNKQLKKLKQPLLPTLINEPVNLELRFYMKSYTVSDLSALYEGIQDVLVEVGILPEDNWTVVASHDGSGADKDAMQPRIEITITRKEYTWNHPRPMPKSK